MESHVLTAHLIINNKAIPGFNVCTWMEGDYINQWFMKNFESQLIIWIHLLLTTNQQHHHW